MNSEVETPQSTESDHSDLDIPLSDTTSMGTPSEEVTTLPEPPGQNRNWDIVPETPRYLWCDPQFQVNMACMLELARMFSLVGRNAVYWNCIMLCYLCIVIICNSLWHHYDMSVDIYIFVDQLIIVETKIFNSVNTKSSRARLITTITHLIEFKYHS